MRVAFLANTSSVWLRQTGKDLLSRLYLVLLHGTSPCHNIILPEYDYFASLMDPSPLKLSVFEEFDLMRLKDFDLLLWEWGWTSDGPNQILRIRDKLSIPILAFPGPIDRFWREVKPEVVSLHLKASEAIDYVGVMLEDTIDFFSHLLPKAKIFHMPVPVDFELLSKFKVGQFSKTNESSGRILLTAPTLFHSSASQIPISTFLSFKLLLKTYPRLLGSCFVYAKDDDAAATTILRDLGFARNVEVCNYARPLFRFLKSLSRFQLGISLPHSLIQGRLALMAACVGLPMVVSSEIETHRRLFPETSVPWTSPGAAANLAIRLMEDVRFREGVIAYAREQVEYYSIANSRARITAAISGKII